MSYRNKKTDVTADELQRKLCRGQFHYLLLWDDGDPDLVDQVLPFGLQKNCCIHHTHLLICKEQRIKLTLETTTQQEGEICFPALNVHYTQLFQPFTEFQKEVFTHSQVHLFKNLRSLNI